MTNTAAAMPADDARVLTELLETVLDKGLHEFEERVNGKLDAKGQALRISFAERASVTAVKLMMDVAKNYAPERKLEKLINGSNKVVPHLRRLFRDEALFSILPAEVKNDNVAALCERAGAAPLAALIREAVVKP